MDITVRPMTDDEYDDWQSSLSREYAEEQVAVGRWAAEGAVERAEREKAELLPDGLQTERMLLLTGVNESGETVGRAWVALDNPRKTPDCAYLFDFEIVAEHRGRGLGRHFLTAVEGAVFRAGLPELELNVFAHNRRAVALYTAADYQVVTQQMRKKIDAVLFQN
ncbi:MULTISPECIES: GNAT family N-acetyltransferase [unclassified Microbacterium]|uniref:GNAT family N-acetyltransferase n=1 Tax=unclassified Microbacterium TaxID=2609290 RepID=UPI00374643AC